MNSLCIIPARWGSTRFPGKPLVDINGKSMIRKVYDVAVSAGCFDRIIVATEDQRIFDHVSEFSECLMTPECASGTDRCAEVMNIIGTDYDVIVNLQGDEPFADPKEISNFVKNFSLRDDPIGTLIKKENDHTTLLSKNTVKVITGRLGTSTFTRKISINITDPIIPRFIHIGIYAFKKGILQTISKLPQSKNEIEENLEQLRWIDNGYQISTFITTMNNRGIDTPEDLKSFL